MYRVFCYKSKQFGWAGCSDNTPVRLKCMKQHIIFNETKTIFEVYTLPMPKIRLGHGKVSLSQAALLFMQSKPIHVFL